jgi:BirA family biotin operon repressor/biotin-[acetyl-CoA-carboxylase] ligase
MLKQDDIHSPSDFIYLAEASSTMDLAAQAAQEGAAHLTAFFAERMPQARGRRGRVWMHVPQCNIGLTFVLRQGVGPQLPLVAVLAVYDALQGQVPEVDFAVKWPNDVLADGKKICGVLVEQKGDIALLGIGINVKTPPRDVQDTLPPDFPGIWLEQLAQRPLAREEIINALFFSLQQKLTVYETAGWAALQPAYEKVCASLGQPLLWRREEEEIKGVALGLTAEGALKLKSADGKVHIIRAGEIVAQGTPRDAA